MSSSISTPTSTSPPTRTRSFWGWGYIEQHHALSATTHMFTPLIENAESLLGNGNDEPKSSTFYVKAPIADEIILKKPKFELTKEMEKICSCDHYLRLTHTHGKSYHDIMRGLAHDYSDAPDYVAQPHDEDEIKCVLKFASQRRIAVVPYGGGSSVVMGVSGPSSSSGYIGWISLSMIHFNRLISVDTISRTICVEAGMYGPALEAALKPYGLSCRHYPQSFEFSTVGGWVATRSAGHFATGLTHIDEYVQSIRAIIPNTSINNGVYETRPLPASGAGIDPNRIMIGSEGILGVITRIHLRVQQRPQYRAAETVYFKQFISQAVPAVREIAQSGLCPTNCRLVDASESMTMGLSTDGSVALLLAFESHVISDFTSHMSIIMEICKRHGGYVKKKKQNHNNSNNNSNNNNNNIDIPQTSQSSQGEREGGAGAWRDNFIAVPYLRDIALQHGLIVETFETACTWSAFPALYDAINHACMNAIKKHCHGKGMITCRFTHVYPDGPAPYFSIAAIGHGTLQDRMQQWAHIKHAASQALVDYQGTASHHHAVGKYHQPYYKQEMPVAYLEGLRSLKSRLDPSWILNPEVLLDVPKAQSKL